MLLIYILKKEQYPLHPLLVILTWTIPSFKMKCVFELVQLRVAHVSVQCIFEFILGRKMWVPYSDRSVH